MDDPFEIPIEDALDLHAFRPQDIRNVVRDYLAAARERGLVEVRLIHGKGRGVQRESVRKLLAGLDFVESFSDGGLAWGDWGATIVVLSPLQ